jgi:transcriptional regulator with XRE-family HTH domain
MSFGERLKEARLKKNWTQEALGAAVGKSAGAISDYESDKRTPRINVLINLADNLEVSVDYLLGRAASEGDLPDDLRELFELAVKAGYAADLKDFFRWLAAKREQLATLDEKVRREPDEELLALVPDLTPDEIRAILSKFKGDVVQRIAKLTPEQTEAFNEEVAKVLYYLELEAKVKRSGELTEVDS